MIKFIRRCLLWAAEPEFQLGLVAVLIVVTTILTISVFLRFVPALEFLAIGKDEPFWVLLLSVLALNIAALMGAPAALAYREVRNNS